MLFNNHTSRYHKIFESFDNRNLSINWVIKVLVENNASPSKYTEDAEIGKHTTIGLLKHFIEL